MPIALLQISPDSALILLTIGILLIYLELNRPGSIFPGAAGLISVLVAAAIFAHHPLTIWAGVVILCGCSIFARGVKFDTPLPVFSIAAILVLMGSLYLVPRSVEPHIHALAAVPCVLVLGISTVYLTRIARRARRNKGLD